MRKNNLLKKKVSGAAMIYAIVALIISLSFSLLFLTYYNISFRQLDRLKITEIGRNELLQGLADNINSDISENNQSEFVTTTGNHFVISKKRWGGYYLFYATVISPSSDTLCSKVVLAGNANIANDTIALQVFNNTSQINLADNVVVKGNWYVPGGAVKYYRGYNNTTNLERLHPSPDTIVKLHDVDTLNAWVKWYLSDISGHYLYVGDTVRNSFYMPAKILEADTVYINASIEGNVIVKAKKIVVDSVARLNDVILLANTIQFYPNCKGRLQAIATDSIIIDKGCLFKYPTLIALVPDAVGKAGYPIILIKDSVSITGNILAVTSSPYLRQAMNIKTGKDFSVFGGMYSSSSIQWEGTCIGSIICNTLTENKTNQDNILSNITIDAELLPAYFAFDILFPKGSKKKVITWLETVEKRR